MRDIPIAVIDLGTEKCTCLIGIKNNDDGIKILGYSNIPSDGVRYGSIVNFEKAGKTIKKAIQDAERMSNVQIDSAYFIVSAPHVNSQNAKGKVEVKNPKQGIEYEDIKAVINNAYLNLKLNDKEVIHKEPIKFIVNEDIEVEYPLGMIGKTLGVDVHFVYGDKTVLSNIKKMLNDIDIELDGFIASNIASSYAVLSELDKDLGTLLVDIGAGTSNLCIYKNGAPIFSTTLNMGGLLISQDLANGLEVDLKEAEKIKLFLSEVGLPQSIKRRDDESFKEFNARKAKLEKIDLKKIGLEHLNLDLRKSYIYAQFIEPRLKEIVKKTLALISTNRNKLVSIVLTGGASNTVELTNVFSLFFKRVSVRVGKIDMTRIKGNVDSDIFDNSFSASIGAFLYLFDKDDENDEEEIVEEDSFFESIKNTYKNGLSKIISIFK